MERRIKKLEDYIGREENGQKWRRLTPLGLLSNLGGTGVVIGLLVYIHSSDLDHTNKNDDLTRQEISTIHQEIQEGRSRRDLQFQGISTRIDCVAQNVKACCKDSENC